MDNCGSTDSSTSGDPSLICESAADPPDPSSGNREQATLDDLAKYMNDSLNFQDSQKLTCDLISSLEKDGTISLGKEDKSDDHYGMQISKASFKSLDKSATFPCSGKISAGIGNLKENEQTSPASAQSSLADNSFGPCLRSSSLPSTLKLVPAIKGSREKLGNPPRKLSVTWSPDVYDPVPTAVSHVPTNKSQRHRSDGKKNGRSKQKGGGKSSRGSSTRSKDKKHDRKVGGSSRCYKALIDDFPQAPPESFASMADFGVGSADAFCGSSFLKKSVSRFHFPVTEAT
ncbi:hypothetical protein LIER_24456 [Lithospermum erythrorhizon]|uniref:Uncharacterized protein n=1 Tax=Lithospermum erythrorhizon TaxID=34254 RepID=A0AAV3R4V7_LITER